MSILKILLNFSISAGLAQIVTGSTRFDALSDLISVIAQNCFFIREIADGVSDHKAVIVNSFLHCLNRDSSIANFPDFNYADVNSSIDAMATGIQQARSEL